MLEIAFGVWLGCHEIACIIVLLTLAPNRETRRKMREHWSEYKFFALAPFILGRSVAQATRDWMREDILRLPPTTARNLLCEK